MGYYADFQKMHLDIKDGFYFSGSSLKLIDIILDELNIYLNRWKANYYEGKLFTDDLMLKYENAKVTAAINTGQI